MKTLFKPVAKAMGREGCTACEARRLITNAWAKLKEKHGPVEAARVMKDLWLKSFKEEPDKVIAALKEALS
jgi:hypothetical protein